MSYEATEEALHILESPDPMSGSQAEEGRRLLRLRPETPLRPRWQIVNWDNYQNLFRKVRNQEQTRIRMRELRASRRDDEPESGATAKRKEKSEVPEDFTPSPVDLEWARDAQKMTAAEIAKETKKFVNHHRAKGNRFKRPDLAWRNWISGRFVGGVRADAAAVETRQVGRTAREFGHMEFKGGKLRKAGGE